LESAGEERREVEDALAGGRRPLVIGGASDGLQMGGCQPIVCAKRQSPEQRVSRRDFAVDADFRRRSAPGAVDAHVRGGRIQVETLSTPAPSALASTLKTSSAWSSSTGA
jgi:hypothetical protein